MKSLKKNVLLIIVLAYSICSAQNEIVWQIGKSDNSSKDFALSNGEYNKFLEKD